MNYNAIVAILSFMVYGLIAIGVYVLAVGTFLIVWAALHIMTPPRSKSEPGIGGAND